MNILETFYFMFDSDAKKLDKGLADSTKSAEKLEKELQQTDKAADMVGGSFMDLAGKAAFALGAIFSIGAIKSSISEVSNFVDTLNDSAEALGVNVSALHAWDNAAQMSGGQTGAFTASLGTLNTGLNAIATKGKGLMLPFFEELGLSMADIKEGAKDPISALEKMSDQFAKLSASEAAGLGAKMGLDQGTINLLREGRAGLDEIIRKQKELGVVTEEQAAEFKKYNDELDATSYLWQDMKRQLVTLVIPALTWFLRTAQSVTAWAKENKTTVAIFFTVLTAAVVAYGQAAIVAGARSLLLYAPIIAAAGAILLFSALLALVTEDLYQFGKGNKSVTGDIVESWGVVGEAIGATINAIGKGLTWLTVVLNAFGQLMSDLFNDSIPNAINTFRDAIRALVADVKQQIPALEGLFSIFEKLEGASFGGKSRVLSLLNVAKGALGATNSPISSQTSNSINNAARTNNKTTTVRVDKVTVNTQATDAEGVAKGFTFSLQKELRNAIDGTDDGVAA